MATNRERRKAHEDRFAAYLEEVRTQAHAAGRRAGMEEMRERAAKVVEDGQETVSTGQHTHGETVYSVTPRKHANIAGLAYAAAIRALAADHAGKEET